MLFAVKNTCKGNCGSIRGKGWTRLIDDSFVFLWSQINTKGQSWVTWLKYDTNFWISLSWTESNYLSKPDSLLLKAGITKPALSSSSLGENPWKCHLCWTSAYSTAFMSHKELAGSELHHVYWIKPRTDKQLWKKKRMIWGLLLRGFNSATFWLFFFFCFKCFSLFWSCLTNFHITLDVVTYQLPNTWSCICMYQGIWCNVEKLFFQHVIVTQVSTCISFVDVFRICAREVKRPCDVTLLQN